MFYFIFVFFKLSFRLKNKFYLHLINQERNSSLKGVYNNIVYLKKNF